MCTLLSSFGQKMYGQKELKYYSFVLLDRFLFRAFLVFSYELFLYYLIKKDSVILRSLSCFNPYFIL